MSEHTREGEHAAPPLPVRPDLTPPAPGRLAALHQERGRPR